MTSIVCKCGHVAGNSKAKALVLVTLFLVSGLSVVSWVNLVNPVYATSTAATLTEWTIPTPASGPVGLALDPTGNCCWFVEDFTNKIAHLDPSTNTFQEWVIPTAGSNPLGLATTMISGQTVIFGTEGTGNKIFCVLPGKWSN